MKSTKKRTPLRNPKRRSRTKRMRKSLNLVVVKKTKRKRKARKTLTRSLLTSLTPSRATRMTKTWRVLVHLKELVTMKMLPNPRTMTCPMKTQIRAKIKGMTRTCLNKVTQKMVVRTPILSKNLILTNRTLNSSSRRTKAKTLTSRMRKRKSI
jgi:hypothetical protein